MVVVSAPVGNHKAVKAPLLPQNLGQQVGIFIGVGAVHLIVAGHDCLCLALSDRDFKGGEVDFPQGTLVHHGVHAHPAQLLGVDGEMLGAGGDAIALNAPDVGGGHLAGQIRVFREILKVTSAQGRALHVEARAQNHVHIVCRRFFAQGTAQLLAQRSIPRVGHGGSGGEAGGGHGGIQAQMIPRPCLLAQAVRAVGQEDGGNFQALNFPGGPGAPAL